MEVYIGIIFIALLVSAVNEHAKLTEKYTLVVFATLLILVAGFRYMVGTDYPVYLFNYSHYKVESLLDFQRLGLRIMARLAALLRDDYATWFFLMSLFSIGLSMKAVSKFSVLPVMSAFLFVFLGCWHGSFNLVKQYAAVAILLMGQNYLINRSFIKWSLVCVLAATFHISAFMMIPVFFIVTREINIRQIFLLILLGVGISFGYDELFDLISFLKEEESVVTIDSSVGSRSVNLLRVAVSCAPGLLLFIYKNCYDYSNSSAKVWANFSLLNAVLYISARKSVYLTRFCVYTDVFNAFFLTALFTYIPRKRDRKIIQTVCMVLYCCFWLYDLSKGSTTSEFHWIFER